MITFNTDSKNGHLHIIIIYKYFLELKIIVLQTKNNILFQQSLNKDKVKNPNKNMNFKCKCVSVVMPCTIRKPYRQNTHLEFGTYTCLYTCIIM